MSDGIKVFWNLRGEVSIEIPQIDGSVWAFAEKADLRDAAPEMHEVSCNRNLAEQEK